MENTNFNYGHDYEKFLLSQNTTLFTFGPVEQKPVKRTFFTYNGLLKVIFRSNSGDSMEIAPLAQSSEAQSPERRALHDSMGEVEGKDSHKAGRVTTIS